MKKVLVLICDKNYLQHAKSLFAGARVDGKWTGDLCLIANNIDDAELLDLKKFGVEIIHKKFDGEYQIKFFIFDEYMKKWDYVIYMDCDFMIFDDLDKITPDNIKTQSLLSVDIEPFPLHESFCQHWDLKQKEQALNQYLSEYDLNKKGFNAGFISFNTSIIKSNTVNDLFELAAKLQPINNHMLRESKSFSDQTINNLYFTHSLYYIENKLVSYWREMTDNTVAAHFCRWDSPWKNTDYSQKYSKKYVDKYIENLNYFYEQIK